MKSKNIFRHITAFLFLFAFLTTNFAVAETLTATEREQLEAQLEQVQAEQKQAQSDLTKAQKKSSSLKNDVAVLTAKIKAEQLDIQAKNLTIKKLGDNIVSKQKQINILNTRIERNKEYIADIFREIDQAETVSNTEIFLSNETISQYWDDTFKLDFLRQNVDALSAQLTIDEKTSTAEKKTLVSKQDAVSDAKYAVQQEQKRVTANQTKQKQLLSLSKNNEKAYSTLVAEKKKIADAISAKLFSLAGGSNPIQFGQAYKYALSAQQKTGIDPAFLLAVMTQESNLGINQGTCYLTDTSTGAGKSVKSGRSFVNVMHPTRDVPPFLKIAKDLSVDPMHTMVSCPQSVGWGGAMGPAQFIASTWMLFTSRVASSLGFVGLANPWNPRDAFMASAIYLSDLGASKGGYTAQSNAACRYYSGSSCSKSALIASYGASVIKLASTIQTTEIDKLQ